MAGTDTRAGSQTLPRREAAPVTPPPVIGAQAATRPAPSAPFSYTDALYSGAIA